MKKNLLFLILISIILILISFCFDSQMITASSSIRTPPLDNFFLGITFVSAELIIFFVLTALFLWNENKQRWIIPLWLTLFLSTAISFILKTTIKRPRPFQLGIVPIINIIRETTSYATWNFSFPSFQAMLAFCAIPILSKEFPKLKWAWIIFALLVGFSRIYFGFHFLSDVIAGALIGYLIGTFIVKLENKKRFGEKSITSLKKLIT